VVLAGWTLHRQHVIEAASERTALGSQEGAVTAQLGSPWRATACGATFGGTFRNGCARELLYASPFAPLIPKYWAFRFDQEGRLIDKYRYVSP